MHNQSMLSIKIQTSNIFQRITKLTINFFTNLRTNLLFLSHYKKNMLQQNLIVLVYHRFKSESAFNCKVLKGLLTKTSYGKQNKNLESP